MKILIALLMASSAYAAAPAATPPATSQAPSVHVVNVTVDESGFTPNEIKAKAGDTVELRLTRTTKDTCATSIVVPSMHIDKKLPLGKTVSVKLANLPKGTVKFGCQMKLMLSGNVVVE
jgi:plastocyanin domain-containing protein